MDKKKSPKATTQRDSNRSKMKGAGQMSKPTRPKQDNKGMGKRVAQRQRKET